MKLPVNYADVRMEQLLQRIRTNYEMAKDADLKLTIIELLLYAIDVIQRLTKVKEKHGKNVKLHLRRRIEIQSDGYSKREDWYSDDYRGYVD